MIAIKTRAQIGISALPVHVEAHILAGSPSFNLVGLAKTAVRESRDRVKSAIKNAGLRYPKGKIVVNLAPADIAKEGGRYDLAIALSLLAASGQLPSDRLDTFEFMGELSLYGAVRPVRGCFCAASGIPPATALIVPAACFDQLAPLLPETRVFPVRSLIETLAVIRNPDSVPPAKPAVRRRQPRGTPFADIKGQSTAKRALVVAAAGAHHILMTGPPGTGKTMLARSVADLMPELHARAAAEVANLYSAAGRDRIDYAYPPFRDPHHHASAAAIVGGGNPIMPGEISMAHNGILFLDELPEFDRSVLEALREPLESGEVVVARASGTVRFPASFQLVAAMNPCPAGLVCTDATCRCSIDQARRYQARISGPLLDRFDIRVAVGPVSEAEFWARPDSHTPDYRATVESARQRQLQRAGKYNRELTAPEVETWCTPAPDGEALLRRAVAKLELSARGIHRVQKVARTLADLDGSDLIGQGHIAEALSYRGPVDRTA